jgi:hypothetical protein
VSAHRGIEEYERRGKAMIAAMWSKLTFGWSDLEDDSE